MDATLTSKARATTGGDQTNSTTSSTARTAPDSDQSNTSTTTVTTTTNTAGNAAPDTSEYDQGRSSDAGRTGAQGDVQDEVVWFVVPMKMQTQGDQLSNGCWVRLYSGDNFDGRVISIVGPTSIRELRSPYGTGLNNWESATVGPNATVVTYDDQNFRARNATLRPGQRYPDLDDSKLGLFDDIESIKVSCTNPSGASATTGS